ncbi:hypothetical protein ABE61_04140 [Lysinibacillus sphaericus]|uniref:hypothetical protein n=1 Tax=Lysinibacillus sphaericus TaxID=1421 RepID=UPI0018CDC6E7|nr:hypothetical protein [Lysinibacillus sphaericus]MBG9453291.1 hypothetical protein [Lysinibacillus sphaericus]MBG9477105.1 hypothetical protein [Lysinibacillus sphaericus]MBG9591187.1 hypothetical protein [Lysinibacillus sphaericus]MBG9591994.1 hypothetical protein [Lysinibacillus sphaericus]
MKYYLAIHGETHYENRDVVLFEDTEGLFKTFREATEFLMNEKELEPLYVESSFLFGDCTLYFELDNGTEFYYGYIQEMTVRE